VPVACGTRVGLAAPKVGVDSTACVGAGTSVSVGVAACGSVGLLVGCTGGVDVLFGGRVAARVGVAVATGGCKQISKLQLNSWSPGPPLGVMVPPAMPRGVAEGVGNGTTVLDGTGVLVTALTVNVGVGAVGTLVGKEVGMSVAGGVLIGGGATGVSVAPMPVVGVDTYVGSGRSVIGSS
jgi:hypothetical protein